MKEVSPATSPISDDRRSVDTAIEAAKRKVQERNYTAALHDCEEAMLVLFDRPSSMAVQHSISEGLECSGDAYFGLKNYEAALGKYEEAFRVRSQVFQRLEKPLMDLLFKLERTLGALYESYYLDNTVEPEKRAGTLNWTAVMEGGTEDDQSESETSVVPGQKDEDVHAVWKRVVKKKSGGGTSLLKRLSTPSLLIPIVLIFILSVTIPLTFSYLKSASDAVQKDQSTVSTASASTGPQTDTGHDNSEEQASDTETSDQNKITSSDKDDSSQDLAKDNLKEGSPKQDSSKQDIAKQDTQKQENNANDSTANDAANPNADVPPVAITKKTLSGHASASIRPHGARPSAGRTADGAIADLSTSKASRSGKQARTKAVISPTGKWMQDAASGQIWEKVFASADKSVLFTFKRLGDVSIRNGPTQITKHFYVDVLTQTATVFPQALFKKCLWLGDAKIGLEDLNGDLFFDTSSPDFLTIQQMFKVAAMAKDNLEALKKKTPDGVSIKQGSGKNYESCLSNLKTDQSFKKLRPGSIVCVLTPDDSKKKKYFVVGVSKSGDLLPAGRFGRSYLTNQEFDSAKVALAGIDVVILTSLDVQQARFKLVLFMAVFACIFLLMSIFARKRAVKAFAVVAMIAAIILTILGLANAITAAGIQTIR